MASVTDLFERINALRERMEASQRSEDGPLGDKTNIQSRGGLLSDKVKFNDSMVPQSRDDDAEYSYDEVTTSLRSLDRF